MRTDLEVLTHDFRIQFINTDFVIYLDATTKAIVNSNLKFGFCSFLHRKPKKKMSVIWARRWSNTTQVF